MDRRAIAALLMQYAADAQHDAIHNADPAGELVAGQAMRDARAWRDQGEPLTRDLKIALAEKAEEWEYEQGIEIPRELYQ